MQVIGRLAPVDAIARVIIQIVGRASNRQELFLAKGMMAGLGSTSMDALAVVRIKTGDQLVGTLTAGRLRLLDVFLVRHRTAGKEGETFTGEPLTERAAGVSVIEFGESH